MWEECYKEGRFSIGGGMKGIVKIDGKGNGRIGGGIVMEGG